MLIFKTRFNLRFSFGLCSHFKSFFKAVQSLNPKGLLGVPHKVVVLLVRHKARRGGPQVLDLVLPHLILFGLVALAPLASPAPADGSEAVKLADKPRLEGRLVVKCALALLGPLLALVVRVVAGVGPLA